MTRIVWVALVALCSTHVNAAIILGPHDLELFQLDPLGVVFSLDERPAELADWYVVSLGDHLTEDSIASAVFPTLSEYIDNRLGLWWATGDYNESLILGYRVDYRSEDVSSTPAFGWVVMDWVEWDLEFNTAPGKVRVATVIGSAGVTDAGGIVVGTLRSIPEPTTNSLLTACLVAMAARSRSYSRLFRRLVLVGHAR